MEAFKMADWEYATGDALTRKAWAKKFWVEARTTSYFYENGLVGRDETQAIIVELPDLRNQQGDRITYGQLRELSGSGVTGDSDMEGNEEEPINYDDNVTLDMKRNAIRLKGLLSGQRPADNRLRMHAMVLLKRWMGGTIDQDIYTALADSSTKAIYGGDATSTATIESGDYFTLALIAKCVAYAVKATPKIIGPSFRGRKTNGIVVISPDQSYDLTERDAAWNQSRMDAAIRGNDNPIFTGALGMHKLVPIHSHERVSISTTWGSGSTLNGATALFMGVGSGVVAYAQERIWNEKTFDYANKTGFCIGSLFGVSKSVFNSADNAIVEIRTFRTNN
jgi:N4-gp56 family major capsid protein